jgi:hypothetical protein
MRADTAETSADTTETCADTAETPCDTAETPCDTAEMPPDTAEMPCDTTKMPTVTPKMPCDTVKTCSRKSKNITIRADWRRIFVLGKSVRINPRSGGRICGTARAIYSFAFQV